MVIQNKKIMNVKKTLKVLLMILALSFLTTACFSENFEYFERDFIGEDGEVDLTGYVMNYAMCASTLYGDTSVENILGFPVNTIFSDLARERQSEVEKNLNCSIQPMYAADGVSIGLLNQHTAAGMYYADVIQGSSEFLAESARAGYLLGLSAISDIIDFRDSDKWGTMNLLESLCWIDDCYGVVPASWPELNYTSFGYPIVANMNLAPNVGWSNLREIVENYEWTWDKFHEVLLSSTIVEGTETKLYGMAVHPQYLGETILRSNGDLLVIEKSDGSYASGYYESHAMKALEELRDLFLGTYSHCFYKTDVAPDAVITAFVEGSAFLTMCDTEHLYGKNAKISQNIENFAILPTPTGPDVDPSFRVAVHESMRYAITFSIYAHDFEASAYIIDALYEPLPGFETFEEIKEYMTHNYFFDERDAELYFELFNLSTYNYFRFGLRAIAETVSRDSSQTIAQILNARGSILQTDINEDVAPVKEALKILWGE